MKGNTEIIATLNELLTGELTAVDVYLLQARMCRDWGYERLAARLDHEREDETRHATALADRIIFLGGAPDVARRLPFEVGDGVPAMLENDLALEIGVAEALNKAIEQCFELGDAGTRTMLQPLLQDTEDDHIFWLESQLHQIGEMGVQNYLQTQA